MIKAVIFDIGGVLVRTVDRSSRARLEERRGLEPGESDELVFNGPVGIQAQLGQISDVQLWAWLKQRLDLTDQDLADFKEAFWGGDLLDQDLVQLLRTLAPGHQLAVISNATDALRYNLDVVHGIGPLFDVIVGSAEEGIMKPDAEIYLRALARLDRQPHEAVFIDDAMPNVAGARAVGMAAIHFTPAVDLRAELRKLGLNWEEGR